jgi:putative transposase
VRAGGGTKAIDTKRLFQSLVKDTLEAFLELEMEEHLGYPKHDPEGRGSAETPTTAPLRKTCAVTSAKINTETPRDRKSSFEPKIVAKRQTSAANFSEVVVSLYARGLIKLEIEQQVNFTAVRFPPH